MSDKARYSGIYLVGDQLPNIDDLVNKAIETLNYSNGYYFNTEAASKEVRKFVSGHFLEISRKVQNRLDLKETEEG